MFAPRKSLSTRFYSVDSHAALVELIKDTVNNKHIVIIIIIYMII